MCTWKGNSGGHTRLYNCLVLVAHPINNIRFKGIFLGQTRLLNSPALADVPTDESVQTDVVTHDL